MGDTLSLTTDPLWPWSLPGYGLIAFLAVAGVLGLLTLLTYLGTSLASVRRLFIVLCLRFLALLLVLLVMLRPAVASRDDVKVPSVLVIVLDHSESMTINDGYGGLSRWDALRRIHEKCAPALKHLEEEYNVTVKVMSFAEEVQDFDPQRKADGKRTDYPRMLAKVLQEIEREKVLRGMVVVSDGANNGNGDPFAEAEKFRRRSCPLHTFAIGQTIAPGKQRDISLPSITPAPAPVPVKNKLTVTGVIDAGGYENQLVTIRLLIDDKEVAVLAERLAKPAGNEVKLTTNAPDKAGEIKVTLKVDPPPDEVIQTNNEITTFVNVSKEGLSVLYVEGKLRAWEPWSIRKALVDPRIRLDELLRLSDEPLSPSEAELFRFDKQHYDVIILGDISARRLAGGDAGVLVRIREEVAKKGTGLIMLGGHDTLAGSRSDWQGTPIAELLPVDLKETGQSETPVRMLPTRPGLDRYVMRLDDDPKKNQELWEKKLLPLDGFTRMGKEKPGAVVLARAGDAGAGAPLLVSHEFGAGRVLALAGETWKWRNVGALDKPRTNLGLQVHARFWKQVALWLARQEEATGNVWIKPDARRVPAGDKLGFNVGLRSKTGIDLADARFSVTVIGPNKAEHRLATTREAAGHRAVFWKADLAGEYKIVVRGEGTDTDGQPISGDASARFLVYQDAAELARQAADHDFLARLANSGGGKAYRADELPRFLQELKDQPLPAHARAKTEVWPDWRRSRLSPFLPSFFVLFVAVLSVEWLLRRRWGLV